MDVRLRALALTFTAAGALSTAYAQTQPFKTVSEALETNARSMSVPSSPDGLMTVTPCVSCAVKMLHSTANTVYLLKDQPVSLVVFRNAVATNSEAPITVLYSVKTSLLVSVNASIEPAAAGNR